MKYTKFFLIISVFSFFVSCNNAKPVEKKEKLVLYEPSELALLMEEMSAVNDSIKSQILRGEIPTGFPDKLMNIHTATMSTNFSRDASFKKFAEVYIENQRAIYTSTKETVKDNFNTTINTCIACHQTSCTGPIPRIQKLFIE